MIAIQVAAGILLAYVIIVNQKRLLAFGGQLLVFAAFAIGLLALVWTGGAAWEWLGTNISPRQTQKITAFIGLIPVFVLAATGVVGMIMLGGLVVGKKPELVLRGLGHALETKNKDENTGCLVIIALIVVMVFINWMLSFPLWWFTPVGEWYEGVDRWSRTNGWADGGSVLFGAVLWQWVWIPLGIYFATKPLRSRGEKSEDNAEVE